MKRIFRLLILAFALVVVLMATSVSASAADLKIGIGIVDASGLRLRSEPSTDSKIISTASRGEKVVILSESNGWYYVNYNLDVGYMSAEFLDVLEKENADLGTGKVTTYVNFRTGPSMNDSVISTVSELLSGQRVPLGGPRDG